VRLAHAPCASLGWIVVAAVVLAGPAQATDLATLAVLAPVLILLMALHFAGMAERPATPAAIGSSKIDDRIAHRCGL
jgi:hypothetical protein